MPLWYRFGRICGFITDVLLASVNIAVSILSFLGVFGSQLRPDSFSVISFLVWVWLFPFSIDLQWGWFLFLALNFPCLWRQVLWYMRQMCNFWTSLGFSCHFWVVNSQWGSFFRQRCFCKWDWVRSICFCTWWLMRVTLFGFSFRTLTLTIWCQDFWRVKIRVKCFWWGSMKGDTGWDWRTLDGVDGWID